MSKEYSLSQGDNKAWDPIQLKPCIYKIIDGNCLASGSKVRMEIGGHFQMII